MGRCAHTVWTLKEVFLALIIPPAHYDHVLIDWLYEALSIEVIEGKLNHNPNPHVALFKCICVVYLNQYRGLVSYPGPVGVRLQTAEPTIWVTTTPQSLG